MKEHEIDKASSFGAVRARLLALAYRMLGSRAEAEDIVQDVWLKWHLADTHEVQTPAAWLTTLTTRTAIDRLRNVQRERESQATGWLPEPWLDEFAPSAEELATRAAEMSYGVMLLLERLKPDERAAFVLHEAFDCDYAEIGRILERTPATCRQIVHRARARLQRAGAPLQRPDPKAHARIVERLRNALEAQDRASLLELFSDAPQVVSDEPVCGPVTVPGRSSFAVASTSAVTQAPGVTAKAFVQAVAAAPERAFGDWMEKVTSLARRASHAELVSVGGALSIALLIEGEVVALIDVSTEDSGNGLRSGMRGAVASGKARAIASGMTSGMTSVAPHGTPNAPTTHRSTGRRRCRENGVATGPTTGPTTGAITGAITGLTTGAKAGPTTVLTHGLPEGDARNHGPVHEPANSTPKIVSLHAVTSASRLEAANRVVGRSAVTELLARIQQRSEESIAMGCDFPVDVYA